MIVPVLNFFASMRTAPVTWILLLANLALFMVTAVAQEKGQMELERIYRQYGHLTTQGEILAHYIQQKPEEFSPLMRRLAKQGLAGGKRSLTMLGQISVRNKHFHKAIVQTPGHMDRVAQKRWLSSYQEVQKIQLAHPSYLLGLSQDDLKWSKWFSYQFMHSGFTHLLGNMFFLLLFGSAVEPLVGGIAIFATYVLSGLAAASAFILAIGSTTAPLVGASGAVSGLMGLFAVLFWGRKVRFFYWLLPIRPYMGFVYLPAWVVLVMWLLSDIAGYMMGIAEIGGVAHTAHLGGTAMGVLFGVLFLLQQARMETGNPAMPPTS